MTAKPISLTTPPSAGASRRRGGLWPEAFALGAAAALGGLALQQGGWGAAAAWAGAAALLPWLLRSRSDTGTSEPAEAKAGALQQQVLPVWQRSIEAARDHSEQSMGQLVERFASLSGQLDAALGAQSQALSLDLGATDELMTRHRAELDTLLATTRDLVARKNEMQATVDGMADTLDQMLTLAQEVQSIGRATHLLALNASVEATRAGAAGGGFAVVAQEVRELAGHSRHTGQQMARHVQAMHAKVNDVRARAQRLDCDDDELERRADQAARGVVRALVGSLAEVGQSSRALRDAGRQAQSDIDDILMGLQSQDRLNQMLASVSEDVARMCAFLEGAPDETGGQPQPWLERLEASYTMEEMRTAHHGNVVVDRQASVEFF